jgi:hypothetical protein
MSNYKIYRKHNYITVVNVNTLETFYGHIGNVMVDKSNTDRGAYRFFNIKDFKDGTGLKIEQLLKEDGNAYTIAEFDTFYTENTGGDATSSSSQSVYSLDRGAVTTTLTTGGISQTIASINSERKGFEIQNQSSDNLILGIGINPSINSGFIIAAGGTYNTTNAVSTREIKIWGATTGQRFTYIEY